MDRNKRREEEAKNLKESEIAAYMASQRDWVVKFLTGLLEIPSESGNETASLQYLFDNLSSLDAQCEKIPIPNSIREHPDYSNPVDGIDYTDRCNIRLTKGGTGGKTVVFNAHVDVVPPSPGQTDPYKPYISNDGIISARGACDDKGSIASMALLVKAACELKALPHDIVCHIVVEEEYGGNGTLAILESDPDFKADALINLEGSGLRLFTSIRGAIWFDFLFSGEAGHSGSAGNTKSATYKAIAAVELLRKYHADLLERSHDYGLFRGIENPMPLTVGQFQAGTWPSMVPSKARIRGVLGFLPNITKQKVMDEISGLFDQPENKWISDGMKKNYCYRHNAVETPVNHWLVQELSNACVRNGLDGTPSAATASSDAVFYSERGVPCVMFGPGSIGDAHSCHEHIALDDILKTSQVLYSFLQETP